MSRKGPGSTDAAAIKIRQWIAQYEPDTIILENPDMATRKADIQREILRVFSSVAEDAGKRSVLVVRQKKHKNLYVEAEALGALYPGMKNEVPKQPPIWMPEPRKTVLFEALAMVEQVEENA